MFDTQSSMPKALILVLLCATAACRAEAANHCGSAELATAALEEDAPLSLLQAGAAQRLERQQPIVSTASPTVAASTSSPTVAASTSSPAVAASTASPTVAASTASPALAASTASPTAAASTASPALAASTASPTVAASTASPTAAASTASPTVAVSSASPAVAASTASPTVAASTTSPALAASTASPTVAASPAVAASTASPRVAASTASPRVAARTTRAVVAASAHNRSHEHHAHHATAATNSTQLVVAASGDSVQEPSFDGTTISYAAAFCTMYIAGCAAVALRYGLDQSILLLWLGSAMFFYIAAGNDAVTTLYALVQIVTTVGYGDITPVSQTGKVAVTFIVLFASVIIGGLVAEVIDFLSSRQLDILVRAMKKAEEVMESGGKTSVRHDRMPDGWRHMLMSLMLFLAFVVGGTLFYGAQGCTCSFGTTRVEGCVPEDCAATGGLSMTWQDAFYLSVITLSTVGFGDYTAETWSGRLFGIFWMLFGVAAMVNFVSAFAVFLSNVRQTEKEKRITKELFEKFDEDKNGVLDQLEFLKLQIQLNGLVDAEVIDSITRQFKILDADGSGAVSMDEVKAYYGAKKLD